MEYNYSHANTIFTVGKLLKLKTNLKLPNAKNIVFNFSEKIVTKVSTKPEFLVSNDHISCNF